MEQAFLVVSAPSWSSVIEDHADPDYHNRSDIFQVVAGNLIGYPQRLKKFGWRQVESSKVGFLGAAKTEAYVLLEEVKEETTAK